MQMQILNTAKRLDWSGWFLGLWTSTISGGAGAVAGALGPMITDSKDFNLGSGLKHTLISVGIGFGVTALVSLAKFLQLHPAPDALQIALENAAINTQKAADAIHQAQDNAPSDGEK